MNNIEKFSKFTYLDKKFNETLSKIILGNDNYQYYHEINLEPEDLEGLRNVNVSDKYNIFITTSAKTSMLKAYNLNTGDACGDLHYLYEGNLQSVRNTQIIDQHLFCCSWDRSCHLLDLRTGHLIRIYSDHLNRIGRCPFVKVIPELNRLFLANYQSDCDPGLGNAVAEFDLSTGEFLQMFCEHNTTQYAQSICLEYDSGSKCLFTGSDDGRIYRRDLSGAIQMSYEGHRGTIRMLALSPDKSKLLSGCGDGKIRVYNAVTGLLLKIIDGFGSEIADVAFAGKYIIGASWDLSLKAFNGETFELQKSYESHTDDLWKFAVFGSSQEKLVSACLDGRARFFEVNTGEEICTCYNLKNADVLWTCPDTEYSKAKFFTNAPEKYIKVYKKQRNKEAVEVFGHERDEYIRNHNNRSVISRINDYNFFKNLSKKNQLNPIFSLNRLLNKKNK